MLLFKLAGLIILFLICATLGFSKAGNIKKRAKKLNCYYRAAESLALRIRTENKETEKILTLCFKTEEVFFKNGKINYNKSNLTASDTDLLNEFFEGFGQRSREDEYERTCLFVNLIKKQYEKAAAEEEKLCKLYSTVGILCGVFVCIFFL